jgi:hypothetical protein
MINIYTLTDTQSYDLVRSVSLRELEKDNLG